LADVLKSKKDVGAVTGLLLHDHKKTIDSTGDWYSTWGLAFPRNRGERPEIAAKSGYVFGATGGASLYRTKIFDDIDVFDESFFAYYEDVDVSFRAQLAGWKVYYTDKAIAYHEQGGSSKKIPGFTIYSTFKNLPLLYIKDVPRKFLFAIGIRLLLAYWLMLFNTIKYGTFLYALKGWLMSVVYAPGAVVKRFRIQSKRKVSNEYIWSMLWQDLPPEQSGLRKFRKIFTLGKID
jgi:GT2 family glycosyltransferase